MMSLLKIVAAIVILTSSSLVWAKEPASLARPLILWMHGCTQSSQEFLNLTALAEKQNKMGLEAVVLAPEQSYFKNPLACWNWYLEINQIRGQGKLQEIVDEIQTKIENGSVDPEQVYVGGFSAGGVMAAHFAYCYPDIFKGALIHSGAPFKFLTVKKHEENDLGMKALECAREVTERKLKEVIVVHGDKDIIAPPSGGRKAVDQALFFMDAIDDGVVNHSLSPTLQTSEQTKWESPSGKSVTYIKLKEMGHAWSGGDKRYNWSSENTMDATTLFLELIK